MRGKLARSSLLARYVKTYGISDNHTYEMRGPQYLSISSDAGLGPTSDISNAYSLDVNNGMYWLIVPTVLNQLTAL